MSDRERTSLEESVIIMRSQVETLAERERERTLWVRGLVIGFALQIFATAFFSGIKWNQVDGLAKDVEAMEKIIEGVRFPTK